MLKSGRPRRLFSAVLLTVVATLLALPARADAPALTNSVAIGNFTVSYPAGWSTLQSGRLTLILDVAADQQAALGNRFVFTPQVNVSTEQRIDHNDALQRLNDIAAETNDPVTHLTIAGYPAIQRRHMAPWPIPGGATPAPGQALTITTAIAAGNELIRLDGSLPSDSPAALADTIAAIETSVAFPSGASSSASSSIGELSRMRRVLAGRVHDLADRLYLRLWSGPKLAMADEEIDSLPPLSDPSDSDSQPAAPGAASRILIGGVASEPEVASSTDGRNIVACQQRVSIASHDGGQTFPDFQKFTDSTGGDCSLAYGKSGDFYEATIANSNKSDAVNLSTDNGKTFNFEAYAFTCGSGQCNFNGGPVADQEHIAADAVNQVSGKDQVYVVMRDGFSPPKWGIVCSTDGGATWSSGNIGISGDFPRVTVGGDGSVYVAFTNGNNLMIDKFASCNSNNALPEVSGWPKTVASGVNSVTCPVPGLDRCNNGNDLRSPVAAVDDTNSSNVYYSYAGNTGSGNEDIFVRLSKDGGATWSSAVTLDGGGTARRYMPWICATKGTAYVSWYDRRAATGANNDLTDYYGASASISGGNLTAGSEFQLNDPSTADTECLAGQSVGSQSSWPGGSRATGDSTSCSEQPELAGVCGTGGCGAGNTCPSGQTCDSTGICRNGPQTFCDFNTTTCPTGDSCQLWGGGTPKYGDYNGNACAAGHLYVVWASATPARATNPGIDLFFKVRDNVTPTATCKNQTVSTDSGQCSAASVSINNGSTDPDGDTFSLSQSPPGPYPKGTTNTTLTITDQNGQSNSCTADITVNDTEKPQISCLSPVVKCTMPTGAVIPKLIQSSSDNCAIQSQGCAPPEGSTFPIGSTPFSCNAVDTSGNSNSCSSSVTVQDVPPVIDSVSASPNVLWPPNHKMVTVNVTVAAHTPCDNAPTCAVIAIASSEPASGGGQGNTTPDYQFTTQYKTTGTALPVKLRAEREGTGNGRTYTITVQCKDFSGGVSAPATTTVSVPHNR